MCGRFAFTRDTEAVQRHFQIDIDIPELQPLSEIFPTQPIAVVALKPDNSRSVALVRWGQNVNWQKQPLINARAESAAIKPTFRTMFSKQRCLVPATSFFEWRKEGKQNIRHEFRFPGKDMIAFAGLWDAGNGSPAVVILTTEPNPVVAEVHDRMPVVITPDRYRTWLDWNTPVPELLGLMKSYPADEMEVIGPKVAATGTWKTSA